MTARPLARILTLRLALMAGIVVLLNLIAVGFYYGSDRRAIEDKAIDHQIKQIEDALMDTQLPAQGPARRLYADHPDAYAFALVNRGGIVLEAVNPGLIPTAATDIFADNWVTRLNRPDAALIVAEHELADRTDGLRVVFVMTHDPDGLLQQALLTELYLHVGLPILPVVLLLICANAWLIRRSLTPLGAAAAWARDLKPGTSVPQFSTNTLPAEGADLVQATQRALNRLAAALYAEARHPAEAAHALRAPTGWRWITPPCWTCAM